jgi:putative ABC transport system permease protein
MNRARVRSLIRSAAASLRAHAFRSALSLLGILFGVASVTAVSAVTEGARREAVARLGDLGADTLVVRSRRTEGRIDAPMRVEDVARLARVVTGVAVATPLRLGTSEIAGPNGPVTAVIVGTDESYGRATRVRATAGRLLSALDVTQAKRVAVLGASIARLVFPGESALGGRVRIGAEVFEVAGVLEPRGQRPSRSSAAPLLGRDVDTTILVPWNTTTTNASAGVIDEAIVRLDAGARPRPIAAAVRRALEGSSGRDVVEVMVPLEILSQAQRTQRVFAIVTGAASLICLLVGAVGIMNILLASVSERVPEIGIRRAVGATREAIGAQFLAEGALLSGAGGLIGLAIGVAAAFLVARSTSWPIAPAPGFALLGLTASVITGLAAGAYPAWKAAHLEVMDALRSR